MSYVVPELPKVIVKPGNMMATSKFKVLILVLALLAYVYVLLFIKTYYLKSKRLDHIMEMAIDTEKKLINVHRMDQNLVMKMAEIEKIYDGY